VLPVIALGCDGVLLTVTAKVCVVELPQELTAKTVMLPLVAPAVAVILLSTEFPIHPVGNVHEYPLAPLTKLILYVCDEPSQTVELPEIAPGCAGALAMLIFKTLGVPAPQELLGVTVMVCAPVVFHVMLTEFPVPFTVPPVTFQVYVTPLTLVTE